MKHLMSVLFVFLLLIGSVVVAQEVTVEPTAEATAEPTPVPPGITLPDLDPVVDEIETGLNVFLVGAGTVMALAAWIITQVGKYVFPEHVADTRQIYTAVVVVFAGIYLASTWFGVTEYVERGVHLLTALSGPALQILILLFGSSLFYNGAKRLNIPFLGQAQGEGALELEKPESKPSFRSPEHAAG